MLTKQYLAHTVTRQSGGIGTPSLLPNFSMFCLVTVMNINEYDIHNIVCI